MKFAVLGIVVFSTCGLCAANVQWNKILPDQVSERYLSIAHRMDFPGTTSYMGSLSLSLQAESNGANEFTISVDVLNLMFVGNWAEAGCGDVVNKATMRGAGPYIVHSWVDDYECSGYAFTVNGDTDFYLMFVDTGADDMGRFYDESIYGWVSFHIAEDGALSILESAYDADGGPMIVGGGSAIPEPSNALLLLAGCAALILKRRRG
jgi:hypothetical protein